MHDLISIILYIIIFIKPPINLCCNNNKKIRSTKVNFLPNYSNQLEHKFVRTSRNDSIFNANYTKIPLELMDPTYGIINYNKKATNNSIERDLMWLSALDKLRNIDLDAAKYANVFSKAFAAGYSAALVDKIPQQRSPNEIIKINITATEAPKDKVGKIEKSLYLNRNASPNEFDTDYAGRDLMQAELNNKMTRTSDDLPFNITSDAVGYGAAYASGYALAAADNTAHMDKVNNSDIKPWKMNNAAAAGYAAYYAAAIAQTRSLRHPKRKNILESGGKSIMEDALDGSKLNEDIQGGEVSISERKDSVDLENAVKEEKLKDLKRNDGSRKSRSDKVRISQARGNKNNFKSLEIPFGNNQVSVEDKRTARKNSKSIEEDLGYLKGGKKERNVQIYEPSEDTKGPVQYLSVNIEQNPLSGSGTINNTSSLLQNETKLDRSKNDDDEKNISANVIIEDGVSKSVSENNNEDLTLDIDSTSLDNKRYINNQSNLIANENQEVHDITGLQQGTSMHGDRRFLAELQQTPVNPNENKIGSIKNHLKRKRGGRCGKRIRRRKKEKKVKSIINCGSL